MQVVLLERTNEVVARLRAREKFLLARRTLIKSGADKYVWSSVSLRDRIKKNEAIFNESFKALSLTKKKTTFLLQKSTEGQ